MERHGRVARVFKDDKCALRMNNIAIVNICNNMSTGKIAMGFYNDLKKKGYNTYFYYGRGPIPTDPNIMRIDSELEVNFHALMARLTGMQGSFSYFATKKLINSMNERKIDTVILISLHGYYLNERMFFNHVAKKNIRMVYTMIDEYAFLGACAFEPPCQKFITGKGNCPIVRNKYPKSLFFDTCNSIIKRKLSAYKKMKNAVFVGPEFLIKKASNTILGQYMKRYILDEAIDMDFYQPRDTTDLRKELEIADDKIIILCVASTSNPWKGADYFIEATKRIGNNERFVYVHIGYKYNDLSGLPSNYIPIKFIESDEDFARYYSMADLLVYPSIADAMSNVCLESFACGTPIVCFDISGMPYLMDNTVGTLVPPRDVDGLVKEMVTARKKSQEDIRTCREYALKRYDKRVNIENLIAIAEEKDS